MIEQIKQVIDDFIFQPTATIKMSRTREETINKIIAIVVKYLQDKGER